MPYTYTKYNYHTIPKFNLLNHWLSSCSLLDLITHCFTSCFNPFFLPLTIFFSSSFLLSAIQSSSSYKTRYITPYHIIIHHNIKRSITTHVDLPLASDPPLDWASLSTFLWLPSPLSPCRSDGSASPCFSERNQRMKFVHHFHLLVWMHKSSSEIGWTL